MNDERIRKQEKTGREVRVGNRIRLAYLLLIAVLLLTHPGRWFEGLSSFALTAALALVKWDLFLRLFRVDLVEHWVASIVVLFGLVALSLSFAGKGKRDSEPSIVTRSFWSRAMSLLKAKPSAVGGASVLLLVVAVAFVSPIIAPADPQAHIDIAVTKYKPPLAQLTFLKLRKSRLPRTEFIVPSGQGFVGGVVSVLMRTNSSILNRGELGRRIYVDEYMVDGHEIRYRQAGKWAHIPVSELEGDREETWVGRTLLLLGSDQFGRDVFSRLLYGTRISLAIAIFAVIVATFLGTLVGVIAGYFSGVVDAVLMRFVDTLLSFPVLFILLLAIALLGNSVLLIILFLGFTGWMGVARLARGEVLSLRERDYIQAAQVLGFSSSHILFRELLPAAMTPVIVGATLQLGGLILVEAGLSFLGLGVQPPTASWGNMIGEGARALASAWWVSTFPGLAIVVTVLAVNGLGEALREALNPKVFVAG